MGKLWATFLGLVLLVTAVGWAFFSRSIEPLPAPVEAASAPREVILRDAEPVPGLTIRLTGLPNILYVGERRNVNLHCKNLGGQTLRLRAELRFPGWTAQQRQVSLQPGDERAILLELEAVDQSVPVQTACVSVFNADVLVWQDLFEFHDALGDLSLVDCAERRFRNRENGHPAILLMRYQDQAQFRRFALLRAGAEAIGESPSHVFLSAPAMNDRGNQEMLVRLLGEALPGRSTSRMPFDSSPLSRALAVENDLPPETPITVCFLWGFEESFERFPLEDFRRALDMAVVRVRQSRPKARIVLASPPSPMGDGHAIGAYVEAIEAVAADRQVALVDLNKRSTASEDWPVCFRLDGDASLLTRYPSEEGLRMLTRWLAENL